MGGELKAKDEYAWFRKKAIGRNFVVSFLETGRYPQEHLPGAFGQLAFFLIWFSPGLI
jgi:hypothetical protein